MKTKLEKILFLVYGIVYTRANIRLFDKIVASNDLELLEDATQAGNLYMYGCMNARELHTMLKSYLVRAEQYAKSRV